ncbi:hypothetical protein WJX84_004979 [Apatococcus fuscideae]|uniref:Uncharacterized protein n=1 Tax=Apatococcus fuscideae TaxID=2026836 RepID=A0AAW1T0D3_9CHLO
MLLSVDLRWARPTSPALQLTQEGCMEGPCAPTPAMQAVGRAPNRLTDLLSGTTKPPDRTTYSAISAPSYGSRQHWRPAAAIDFGQGGAFPECGCFQYPEGLGSSKTFPEYLLASGRRLKASAMEGALHVPRRLPEHSNLMLFTARCHAPLTADQVPQSSANAERLTDASLTQMAAVLASPSRPVIITDAFRDWPAMSRWDLGFFNALGQSEVVVNDRAPARHADESAGERQRSLPVCLPAYVQYVQDQPASIEEAAQLAERPGAPFYLNGWRAFAAHPSLEKDCPGPYFMSGLDSSSLILEAIDKQLFSKQASGRAAAPAAPPAATAAAPWWQSITTNLKKVFIGPAGLHNSPAFRCGLSSWLAGPEAQMGAEAPPVFEFWAEADSFISRAALD